MRRFLLWTFPLLTACYTYVPVEPAATRPGMSVRARVTAVAATRVAPLLGMSDARLLTGRLIESGADGMIIEVPSLAPRDFSSSSEILHQRVSIARTDLLELEGRSLDKLRTGVLVGGTALVLGVTLARALKGDPSTTHVTPSGPAEIRLAFPILHW